MTPQRFPKNYFFRVFGTISASRNRKIDVLAPRTSFWSFRVRFLEDFSGLHFGMFFFTDFCCFVLFLALGCLASLAGPADCAKRLEEQNKKWKAYRTVPQHMTPKSSFSRGIGHHISLKKRKIGVLVPRTSFLSFRAWFLEDFSAFRTSVGMCLCTDFCFFLLFLVLGCLVSLAAPAERAKRLE